MACLCIGVCMATRQTTLYLKDFFYLVSDIHSVPTGINTNSDFYVFHPYLEIYKLSFLCNGPMTWNRLPQIKLVLRDILRLLLRKWPCSKMSNIFSYVLDVFSDTIVLANRHPVRSYCGVSSEQRNEFELPINILCAQSVVPFRCNLKLKCTCLKRYFRSSGLFSSWLCQLTLFWVLI